MRLKCRLSVIAAVALTVVPMARFGYADVPIGGYIPYLGFGLTDAFESSESGSITFFLAQASSFPEGTFLGGGQPYFDIGLLDTGAATHILTMEADAAFDIHGAGFDGTELQLIGGATGQMVLSINDPLSIYAAGLGSRESAGAALSMNTSVMRGQSSVATLSAPEEWELPNIVGLPLAAQHAIAIRNDLPQIFEYRERTVRTPDIQIVNLGTGGIGLGPGGSDILRRTPLQLEPGIGFIQGPLYVFNYNNILEDLPFHENPMTPTVVENGALFVEVDLARAGESIQNVGFLFDTGADLTVISEQTAALIGIDPILDPPDFMLEVEGSGGVIEGIPGFYVDELNLDTVGGSFTLTNIPIAVLDVTNPSDPGNVVPGILGTHLFYDRNIVIDARPSTGQGGVGPSLYISDPVTETHTWSTTSASGDWQTAGNWNSASVPGVLGVADVGNTSGMPQQAVISENSQVYRVDIAGSGSATMSVRIQDGATLLVYAGVTVTSDAALVVDAGGKVDAQFVQLDAGGLLAGNGSIFVGAGPIDGQVRNMAGTVAPGDTAGHGLGTLAIEGDFSNRPNGTFAIDLGGTTAGTEFDRLLIDGAAYLGGTLEVTLVDSGTGLFVPDVGDLFTILTATDGVSGMFETLFLPNTAAWEVHYTGDSVMLEVLSLAHLPADFNEDGMVDADDFSIWQTGFGTISGALPSQGDANGDGSVDGADFLVWQRSLGATTAAVGAASTAVPEPNALLLAGLFLASLFGPIRDLPKTRWVSSAECPIRARSADS